jgi:hypothetical protein
MSDETVVNISRESPSLPINYPSQTVSKHIYLPCYAFDNNALSTDAYLGKSAEISIRLITRLILHLSHACRVTNPVSPDLKSIFLRSCITSEASFLSYLLGLHLRREIGPKQDLNYNNITSISHRN